MRSRAFGMYRIALMAIAMLWLPLMMMSADDEVATSSVEVRVLRSDDLKEPHAGRPAKSSLIEITIAPGAGSPPHRHPGPVVGYVLEGTYEFQIGDQPLQTLHVGDTFFEPAMILHRVSRNPDRDTRTRILVTMIHPADATRLVIPADVDLEKVESK